MSKLTKDILDSLVKPEPSYGQVTSIKNGIADVATKSGLKSFPTISGLKAGDNVLIKNNTLFQLSPAKTFYV